MSASSADVPPMQKARPRKGRRMNSQLAPTSFMVLIMKRWEKMVSFMVLFISAKEIYVKSAAIMSSIMLSLRMFE